MKPFEKKTIEEITLHYIDTVIDKWNELLDADEINFGDLDLSEEETVFCATAKFDDGCKADIKVCTSSCKNYNSNTGSVWAEAVLFDDKGHELTVSSS